MIVDNVEDKTSYVNIGLTHEQTMFASVSFLYDANIDR